MFRYDPLFSLPISNAIGYAKFRSRSHDAVIRVYDEASGFTCYRVEAVPEMLNFYAKKLS